MPTFDWSGGNDEKIRAGHDVEPDEVEEALHDRRGFGVDVYNVEAERRWGWVGATLDGRLLQIVFTRRNNMIRPISARDANARHLRRYGRYRS